MFLSEPYYEASKVKCCDYDFLLAERHKYQKQ